MAAGIGVGLLCGLVRRRRHLGWSLRSVATLGMMTGAGLALI
jgi:hypothetical protein